ncbi:unnamed protein product, partial [Ectocarpus sp. 12 AP-2014]
MNDVPGGYMLAVAKNATVRRHCAVFLCCCVRAGKRLQNAGRSILSLLFFVRNRRFFCGTGLCRPLSPLVEWVVWLNRDKSRATKGRRSRVLSEVCAVSASWACVPVDVRVWCCVSADVVVSGCVFHVFHV